MAKGYVVGSNKCLIPSYDAEQIEEISGYFIGEWSDGNPNNEDRTGRFVTSSNNSNKIELANADSYIAGVSEAYEGSTKKVKVNPIGLTTVLDNGALSVGDKCMPSTNGIAVKSSNNLGYRVVARIDTKHVQIIASPNNDMIQRIKVDVTNFGNQNLLINSGFISPINQRGQTTYTVGDTNIYTIDRWLISNNSKLEIKSGFIRQSLNLAQKIIAIQQNVEMPKDIVPDTMTLSVKMRASVKSKFQVYDTNRYFDVGTDWDVIKVTFTKAEIQTSENALKDGYFKVFIGIKEYNNPNTGYLPSGAYIDIQWAKLEVGSVATPYVPRNPSIELEMCQRYFTKIIGWQNSFNVRGDNNYTIVSIPNLKMRIAPSATNIGFTATGFIGTQIYSDVSLTNLVYTNQYPTHLSLYYSAGTYAINYGIGLFTEDLELNAEIY